jgi:hypothetical protein
MKFQSASIVIAGLVGVPRECDPTGLEWTYLGHILGTVPLPSSLTNIPSFSPDTT